MKKTLLINEILDKISDLNDLGDGRSGLMLIYGDADSSTAVSCLKGNNEVLASALGGVMDSKPEVKRVLFSLFGAYLILNPDMKDVFIKGLEVTELPFNLN